MKLDVDGIPVFFPYDYVYQEQYDYMYAIKQSVENEAHCMLEMPSGTGKTISLLSLLVSYMKHNPNKLTKIVYCSRTVSELEKVIAELKHLVNYIENETKQKLNILGISLSARKNMCINSDVLNCSSRNIDVACRSLTASFVQARHQIDDTVPICKYFEKFDIRDRDETIPYGIYDLEDLKEYGQQNNLCPYFLTRNLIMHADIIVYSYHYLLDPKIANLVSKDLPKSSVVIFDEAHNIDNVCIESMSCTINRNTIKQTKISLTNLHEVVRRTKQLNEEKLSDEYRKLVDKIRVANQVKMQDLILANPTLPSDILTESMPGCIRKADHFLNFIERFVEFIDSRLRTSSVRFETPLCFMKDCTSDTGITRHPLKFCSERIQSILHNLEISDLSMYQSLLQITNFATMVATYVDGFSIIIEPFDERTPTIAFPVLHFNCMNSSLAIKPVFARFNTVIITSGTLSPMDIYKSILDFNPGISLSLSMSLARNCIKPLIVTKGKDQVAITTKFESREDTSIIRNYGHLLLELSMVVPDGLVAFFPSYTYLETTFTTWYSSGIVSDIQKHKLIFIETQDADETNVALYNYKKACENGRGAILLSVARGKVSEGIDFDHHLGRCVIMFGIPFFFTQSRIIKARLHYLRDQFRISENDFINFDAMRHAAQCLGRAIRGKTDYGLMILADKRYNRPDKRGKLPRWISSHLNDSVLNLSTEEAVQIAKRFLREMGQEFNYEEQLKLAAYKKTG